jgi:RecA/RadA recombinase
MAKKKLSAKEKFEQELISSLEGVDFESSKYGEVTEWIDIGDPGVNRICSGDIHKGIPCGRVVVFTGESQSGKSLLSCDIASNSLNINKFDKVFYFDSEGGAMKDMFKKRGCDLKKVIHVLVETVEDALIKIADAYQKVKEFQKEEEYKALFILDSLGALITNKVLTDLEKKKVANDMGLRAKVCNLLVKACTIPALKTNVPFIIINHVYDDPNMLHAQKIKNMSGGKGIQYQARLVIQCAQNYGIDDKDKKADRERYFNYNRLTLFTTKNSFAKPTYQTEMILNLNKGPLKLLSIFKPAIKYGFIKQSGSWYTIPSHKDPEKKFRSKDILTDESLWESFIDDFNQKSIDDLSYGGKEVLDDDQLFLEEQMDDPDIDSIGDDIDIDSE